MKKINKLEEHFLALQVSMNDLKSVIKSQLTDLENGLGSMDSDISEKRGYGQSEL